MNTKIHSLLLWPRDARFAPRVVDFSRGAVQAEGVVQVIRGTNGTGKSAILHIIDYCLGARLSQIPQDEVFQSVAWYGIQFVGPAQSLLVARSAPAAKSAAEEFFVDQSPGLDRPELVRPAPNVTRAEFARALDRLAGLDVEMDDGADDEADDREVRPLLHDLTPFLLAPSEYLTRPGGLFHTRSVSIERVKRIVPLALQAATAEYVLAQDQERKLRRSLRKAESQANASSEALAGVESTVSRVYAQAQAVGMLLPIGLPASTADVFELLSELHARLSAVDGDADGAEAWRAYVARIDSLEKRQRGLERDRREGRRRLGRLREGIDAASDASAGMAEVQRRTTAFDWIEHHATAAGACPICGSHSDVALGELLRLGDLIADLREDTDSVQQSARQFTDEALHLEQHLAYIDRELEALAAERLVLETGRPGASRGLSLTDAVRMIANLDHVVASGQQLRRLSRERDVVEQLRAKIRPLQQYLRAVNFDALLEGLEEEVVEHLRYHAAIMHLESADSPIRFSLRTLQLLFRLRGVGAKYASRRAENLGSGKNWMGYKIAAHLALHELFHLYQDGPMPAFFVVDQPSQVDSSGADDGATKTLTTRVFESLTHIAQVCGIQVIVLEGMADHSFLFMDGVSIIEEWPREGFDGLVPQEWILRAEE